MFRTKAIIWDVSVLIMVLALSSFYFIEIMFEHDQEVIKLIKT